MNTPLSSETSPPISPPSNPLSKKYSTLNRLHYLLDHARETAGLLTPTETLELVDIAEHYKNKYYEAEEEIAQLTWDIRNPTLKYL